MYESVVNPSTRLFSVSVDSVHDEHKKMTFQILDALKTNGDEKVFFHEYYHSMKQRLEAKASLTAKAIFTSLYPGQTQVNYPLPAKKKRSRNK